jgi:hypothetical protein
MSRLRRIVCSWFFCEIDRPIEMLREVRDSYRAMNVEVYGEKLASLLNDW